MPSPRKKAQMIERLNRIAKVRVDYLSGRTNQSELAAKYGVNVSQINRDFKYIANELAEEHAKDAVSNYSQRMGELAKTLTDARNSFEISRKVAKVTTVTTTPKTDPTTGKTELEEVTTTKVRGKAGDPAFLKVCIDCIKEMGKLQGLYIDRHELSGKGGKPIEIKFIDDSQATAVLDMLRANRDKLFAGKN